MTVWGVLTGFLIVLMIYRATLMNHEDDQLFLSAGESNMAKEQAELVAKLNKLEPVIKSLAWVCGIMLVGLGAFWFHQSMQASAAM
jgi:hypothetical protein